MALNESVAGAVRAEAARRGWKTDELARRSGITRRTMFRLVDPDPTDRSPAKWTTDYIEAVAAAFGIRVSELMALAEQPGVTAHPGEDPRSLIAYLLNNPTQDDTLNTRLSEAESRSGLRGSQLAAFKETIRNVRRRELGDALRALPPSEAQGGAEFKAE